MAHPVSPEDWRLATGTPPPETAARAGLVFCSGPLLHAVQQARLFGDSKTFVDMPLLSDPEEVLAAFEALPDKGDADALRAFVALHFAEAGKELVPQCPADYVEQPPRLARIQDSERRAWALALNVMWSELCRVQSPDVAAAPQRYSALPRRFPMMVPGGRFRETYYWDTYWIVLGLLACGMATTARGVVDNLVDDVRNFGFVPNGGRIYYLDRSQPPLLSRMVMEVFNASSDTKWLAEVLPFLEAEYRFWMDTESGRVVEFPRPAGTNGPIWRLNIYRSARTGPRPESYAEDFETCKGAATSGRDQADLYRSLCSGAESGWDFSTRWFRSTHKCGELSAEPCGGLASIDTCSVVPVDLNCFLYRVEHDLAEAHLLLQGEACTAAQSFLAAAATRKEAMDHHLWAGGSYHDYLTAAGGPSRVVSLVDWAAPLWCGLAGPVGAGGAQAMVESLQRSGLLQAGGAASTALDTAGGTQWDAPNAWPPLQHLLVQGLRRTEAGAQLSRELREAWLASCLAAWKESGHMYEKYHAGRPGQFGSGGEYEPQVGFGWSNGVVLVFLAEDAEERALANVAQAQA